jgi:hypothetical protein
MSNKAKKAIREYDLRNTPKLEYGASEKEMEDELIDDQMENEFVPPGDPRYSQRQKDLKRIEALRAQRLKNK